VDGWISRALGHGPCHFAELLSRLPGVYPCTVLKALSRIQQDGRLDPNLAATLEREASTFIPAVGATTDILPPPHPLDFEWRFTGDTARKILSIAHALTKPHDSILLFGTPAVAAAATTASFDRAVVFVGEDNRVTDSVVTLNKLAHEPIHVQIVTARQHMPVNAGVVVVDPPWYPDFMRPMLALAASACRVGGHVLISLLPVGTRPGAERDREWIIAYLRRFSLHPVETTANALTYDMPFFEANALAAAGLRGVPAHWRRGDLLVSQKTGTESAPMVIAPREKAWHDIAVGRMRLFVNRSVSGAPYRAAGLESIVPGDILPTVSRRDSRRRKAQVWTSGNRVFRSPRPDLVLAAARHAASNRMPPSRTRRFTHDERDEIARLSYALVALASKEKAEENNCGLEHASCIIGLSTSGVTQSSATLPITVSG
jgi:hypothetical protein